MRCGSRWRVGDRRPSDSGAGAMMRASLYELYCHHHSFSRVKSGPPEGSGADVVPRNGTMSSKKKTSLGDSSSWR